MSYSETVEKYGDYLAAKAYKPKWSSATNVDQFDPFAELDFSNIATTEPTAGWRAITDIPHLSPTSVSGPSVWSVGNILLDDAAHDIKYISAFDELDTILAPQGEIRRLILGIRLGSLLPYKELLAERLELLVEAMDEESEEWTNHSGESLRKMLMFLETIPQFRLPEITVTPAATFRAQWTENNDFHFAVDFLPDGQVQFVVFCPSARHPKRVKRIAGKTSWETLMAEVLPYGVSTWTRRAG